MPMEGWSCPQSAATDDAILLAHGGGGRLMHQLLERLVFPKFRSTALDARHDGAVLPVGPARLAFTTDSYVVSPYVFPGGDIGSLSVHGTINDLAMCGARPLALSAALLLEEGFPTAALDALLESMSAASRAAGVPIVTGDTKVLPRGRGDGVFVNTSGVGVVEHGNVIAPGSVRRGDAIVLSGDLGRHGIAVLSAREGLRFETDVQSDSAPLWEPVRSLLAAQVEVHCLRDLTRGGLASALVEIAESAALPVQIDEAAVPVLPDVRAACELLGLDPLHVANEGRFVAFVPGEQAEPAVAALLACPQSAGACVIGRVAGARPGMVVARTPLGTTRLVDMFSGEQLPRIC